MFSMPTTINDLIISDTSVSERLRQYAEGRRKGNILIYGPKGLGKTEAAKAVARTKAAIFDDFEPLIIRGSSVRADFETQILNDWNIQTLNGVKNPFVVIDEVDELSNKQQRILRAHLDHYQRIGNVVLTTNHRERLDLPLIDRCDAIEMPPIDPKDWLLKSQGYLSANGKSFTDQSVLDVLATTNGSIRDIMRAVDDLLI